ncbi:Ribonuclease Z 1 [Purpureocillium lavendulum]|uniref:Ribonuclease Z 1 n=1 Tax=Purpureocillium lavendulum TaxID=1247861 RepID=A0AB34G6Y9_9HYPO|nr:Ribonuclease Z 1 [Purpureocillium lavendulum]
MGVWRDRRRDVVSFFTTLAWVGLIYATSELVIWGLSRLLSRVQLEFFASVMAMILAFVMDLINSNLGIGFSIPICLMKHSDILSGHDIIRVFATFVITNLAAWIGVFLAATAAICLIQKGVSFVSTVVCCSRRRRNRRAAGFVPGEGVPTPTTPRGPPESMFIMTDPSETTTDARFSFWCLFKANCTIVIAFLGVLLVGAPMAAIKKDERWLDAFVIWFVWSTALRLQQLFKASRVLEFKPKVKSVLATLMNPVLGTTLLLIAYTRSKAALKVGGLPEVLATLSSGTPLYSLWNSLLTRQSPPRGPKAWIRFLRRQHPSQDPKTWFGAGDFALSILECGLFTWGFKLYECRRQLFSLVGLGVSLVCIAVASANVFLSVLIARSLDLATPESLAFASRSTTLALSKPAMTAIGGNLAINAMIVVSNGILGQLIFPFALERLGVQRVSSESNSRESAIEMEDLGGSSRHTARGSAAAADSEDTVITVAAGVAAGVNAAAMSASYMYEKQSRAAPYAVLSMVVFGVSTVVITTVNPFKEAVLHIAKM